MQVPKFNLLLYIPSSLEPLIEPTETRTSFFFAIRIQNPLGSYLRRVQFHSSMANMMEYPHYCLSSLPFISQTAYF
jgi:hypothetical protein